MTVAGGPHPGRDPAADRPARDRTCSPTAASCSRCATPSWPRSSVKEFLTTPIDWYFHLALEHLAARAGLAERDRGAGDLRRRAPTTCSPAPATWPARGRADRGTPTYVELRGTHFIQMEQPDGCTRCCSTSSTGSADARARCSAAARGSSSALGSWSRACCRLRQGGNESTVTSPAPRRRPEGPASHGHRSDRRRPRRRHDRAPPTGRRRRGRRHDRHRSRGALGPGLPPRRRRHRHRARHPAGAADRAAAGTRCSELGGSTRPRREGEGGLLGVAVSPDFATTDGSTSTSRTATDNRIVRASAAPAASSGRPAGAPRRHPQRLHPRRRPTRVRPRRLLYVSTGETGEPALAQDPDSLGGKILRITTDGEPGPRQPLRTAVCPRATATCRAWPSTTGQLWASEFGQDLRRAQPDRGRATTTAGPRSRAGRPTPRLRRPPAGLGHRRRLAVRPGLRRRLPLDGRAERRAAVAGRRCSGDRAGDPTAFFVGDYGRMRTVVAAPDGTSG